MKKPWSIATTLRNPERLQGFLRVLNQLDGLTWDSNSQKKFQILLIQNRLYGYDSTQFYNTLTKEQISLLNNISKEISFSEAESIFLKKRYKDPAMRGRQSINPLRKLGFVYIRDKKIFITSMGKLFLKDSSDLGEVFLKSFLKWQIPNLDDDQQSNDGYDIKPFVGTLHLIDTVNKKESINGNKAKGISKKEFALFVPTLVHYNDIDLISDKIIALRSALHKKTKKEQKEIFEEYRVKFATEFLGDNAVNATQSLLNNLDDYGDNAIRYFRLTRYIHIRGNEFYIDIEPRRSVEIESLLQHDNAQSQPFNSKEEYFEYISDVSRPQLPWETKEKYTEIIVNLINDIQTCEADLQKKEFTAKNYRKMDGEDLKKYIGTLREYRRTLEDEKTKNESQETKNIEAYITSLKNIFDSEDRSLLLEKMSALSLFALNDALKVKPNYPVGDDNEPTFTAPAITPDI